MTLSCVDREGSCCSKWDGLESKFGRSDVLPLWVADMDFASPKSVQDALASRVAHPVYAYTIYDDEFYDSILRWYKESIGWEIKPEWIVPEHGVVISMNLAINEYSQEGDGVLVQTPIYPPFISSVKRNRRKLLENRLVQKDGKISIDFADFEQKAKDAKLFLLCSPHNPTTRSWSEDELQKMLDICIENSVIIVSDEIHSDLVFGKKHVPIASLKGASGCVLTLHAPSKTFNIAGLNTSYAIIENDSLRRRYNQMHKKAGLDNGNLFGIEALKAAYNDDREWIDALFLQIKQNYEYVKSFIDAKIPQISVYEHDATFLMWLDCKALGMDDDELERFFIEDAKLGLNSGYSFGEAGSGFMRLNIGTSAEILEVAMQRLYNAINSEK